MDKVLAKITSGRFLFVVACAAVYVYMAAKNSITSEQAMSITMLVVGFYFNRSDRKTEI